MPKQGRTKLCVRNLCYLCHKNVIIILRANLNEKNKNAISIANNSKMRNI